MSSDPLRPYNNHTEILLQIPGKPDLQLGWEDINYEKSANGWKPIFDKKKYKKIMIERSLMNPEDDINFIFQSGNPNNKFIITRLVKIPVLGIRDLPGRSIGEAAYRLILDTLPGLIGDKWLNFTYPTWIECDFRTPTIVSKIRLMSANDEPHRDPAKIRIFGINTNKELVHLKDLDVLFESRHQWKDFEIVNEIPVIGIRFEIETIRGGHKPSSKNHNYSKPALMNFNTFGDDNYVQLARIQFMRKSLQSDIQVQEKNHSGAENVVKSINVSTQANNRAVSRNASAQANNRHILGSLINVRSKLIDHLRIAAPEELHNIERYLESRGSFRPSTEGLPRASQLSLPFSAKVRPSTVGAAGGSNLANLKLRSLGGIGNQRPASTRNITNRRKVGTLLGSLGNENEVNLPGSVRNGGGGGGGGYRLPPLKTRSESKEEERPQSAGILGRLKFFGSGSVKEQSVSLKLGHELMRAIKEGNSEKALSLISQGADINITGMNGNNPLFLALDNKLLDVAEKLLDLGAIVGEGEMRYKILVASKGTPLMQKMLSKKRKNRRNRTRKN